MKLILPLLLLSALAVTGAVPSYLRHGLTTNDPNANQFSGNAIKSGAELTNIVVYGGLTSAGNLDIGGTLSLTTPSDGILRVTANTVGAVTIGSGLTFDGTTLSASGGGSQTPWTSDIDAAQFRLTNAGVVMIRTNLLIGTNNVGGFARSGNAMIGILKNATDVLTSSNDFLRIVDVSTGDAEVLIVKNSGRVGIGTVNPSANLDVPGTNTLGTIVSTNFQQAVTNATGTAVTIDLKGPNVITHRPTTTTTYSLTNLPAIGSPSSKWQFIIPSESTVPSLTFSVVGPATRQINWIGGSPFLRDASTNILNILFDGTNFIGSSAQEAVVLLTNSFGITIDGGGSAITTGTKGYFYAPYACTIRRVTMLADQVGSAVIDVWKDTYANYPPTVADTITASAKPTISSNNKSADATLTGWTTSVAQGDVIAFNVDSASAITRVSLSILVTHAP